ncbi:MAG: bifunctional transaldolase/phosoglucose isomerase [Gammaproteobacteria bacterium]|nr:bifunctional transaldolase/phosoglucose isomerase [Gammaproteobacteria bacterium]MCF6363533.1 bifunctional transaldolase/phosoglucose isomerase [Gammaproteobacteria bacterium]
MHGQSFSLPTVFQQQLDEAVDEWQANGKVARLWARDASLWAGRDEDQWLDWLTISRELREHTDELSQALAFVREGDFSHAVLLGMGGSSLGPEVLQLTFGTQPGHPQWLILDSTDPAHIRAVEAQIDYAHSVFLVSSKSGSTLEPNIFKDYFFTRATEELGQAEASARFMTVTDPGSNMESVARADNFRAIFYGKSKIGGRYSVLSNFGLVPAAVMGVDVARFLDCTEEMVAACEQSDVARNPGVMLGLVMGLAAKQGRDKLTILTSPGIRAMGAWMEQLVAESTGKQGKGIIPVDGEALAAPEHYGDDRLFAYLHMAGDDDSAERARLDALVAAGHPLVRIELSDAYDLGKEFFRWEIATAVAGAVLNIHPFDQPDVEASKIETRKLTEAFEASGSLPEESAMAGDEHFTLFTDDANTNALRELAGADASVEDYLKAHLGRLGAGDYLALLAYINRLEPQHDAALQQIRNHVSQRERVATCVGYGPRFLHSTGQAYKGGPNSGVFLQITCDDAQDLPVPSRKYSFGVVKAAQAQGDFQVLSERKRRALRLHIGADTVSALQRLANILA